MEVTNRTARARAPSSPARTEVTLTMATSAWTSVTSATATTTARTAVTRPGARTSVRHLTSFGVRRTRSRDRPTTASASW